MAAEQLGLEVAVIGFTKFNAQMDAMDKAIDGTSKAWAGQSKAAKSASNSLQQVAKNIGLAAKETKKLLNDLQPLGIAFGAAAAGGTLLMKSSIMAAARVEELGMVLLVIAENARKAAIAEGDYARANELTEEKVLATVEAIRQKGITEAVALKLTAQAIRYELDMADAVSLARVAQDAATISKQDSSDALAGLIHGITTYNVRVLRTYGITLQAADAYEAYARANGLVADELTNAQKMQAMLNGVLKEGDNIAGAYEAAMGSAGKQLRSFSRRDIEDAKVALGKAFLPAMYGAVMAARDLIGSFNKLSPATQAVIGRVLAFSTAAAGLTSAVILVVPRIISLVQSLGPLITMAQNTGTALQLVAQGASVADLGLAGFAAKTIAVVAPIAALIAIVLLANEAMEGHHEKTIALSDSYERYEHMMQRTGRASEMLTEEEYALAQVTEETTGTINTAAGAMFDWEGALSGTHQAMGGVTEATGAATAATAGLADSVASLAGQFGELEFDNESIWEMARASGASLEALSQLAVQLGIASNAEINAVLSADMLTQQFGAGNLTASEYSVAMEELRATTEETGTSMETAQEKIDMMRQKNEEAAEAARKQQRAEDELTASTEELTTATDEVTTAHDGSRESMDDVNESATTLIGTADGLTTSAHVLKDAWAQETEAAATADEKNIVLTGSMEGAADAAGELSGTADNLTASMGDAAGQAGDLAAAIARIQSKTVTVTVNYVTTGQRPGGYQHGTDYFRGGRALVGEGGPEMVELPRGTRIFPNYAARTQAALVSGATQNVTNNVSNVRNYNLTTNATTRPGGLSMEFATMAMAGR